jgi:hypothetical protein
VTRKFPLKGGAVCAPAGGDEFDVNKASSKHTIDNILNVRYIPSSFEFKMVYFRLPGWAAWFSGYWKVGAAGEGFPQGRERDCLICRDQTYGTKIGRNIT